MSSTPAAPPPSAERFLQMVARSGLLDRNELRQLADSFPKADRRDSRRLADRLVEAGRLTHFQAEKLLKGAWQGLVLGPYQILAPLGRGGMGSVYLARHSAQAGASVNSPMPPLVALKVLPPKRAKAEGRVLARFQREMELCQRVGHPHLTRTFEAGVIDGVYYIAMEYIRGTSLSRLIKDGGPLPVARAARLFAEIAAGLEHAHEVGLIHRDLKPSNIMVTPNGHGKVLDLGLALAVDEVLPEDKTIVGGQGYVVGTMDYIAPEQVDDAAAVDARADLYALGCSLYFALSGQPPFPGGTSRDKMRRQRTDYAEPLAELNPAVPAAFARLVERLMEKDPERRYRSAAAVRAALLPWAADDPERPLDVDPHLSEAEALRAAEREQADEDAWWETVPVISFEATARHSTRPEAEAPSEVLPPAGAPQSYGNLPVVLAIVVGLIVVLALLELLRR
jgi:serine/threonine protein kinase